MDPIEKIHVEKDSTLALLLAAQVKGWEIFYMEQKHLFLQDGVSWAHTKKLKVFDKASQWFTFAEESTRKLHDFDVILMRKDPPFDMEYISTTYLLENAEAHGALIINKPQSLRDANEKLFISWFPQCCPKTLVARDIKLIHDFLQKQQEIVLKPLGGMGGASVFYIHKTDVNAKVIMETLTENEQRFVMAQQYIPDILRTGDKRIFMIDGKPVPYALARIPAADDFRGNLASGAHGEGVELTERDYWICEQVGPTLRDKGLLFVGLDVIGDYLTEINVTSPTGIRQIEKYFKINVATQLLDIIKERLIARS